MSVSRDNTFLATIKERYCLNPDSEKETYHFVIDLKGSGIEYKVGDCLGIYAQNDPVTVKSLLSELKATGKESIQDRKGKRHGLKDFLLNHANLNRLPKEALHPDMFCQRLSPMLPRFYSIASSMKVVGEEAHLTVLISGTCSHFLCKRAEIGKPNLPVFHHPSRNFFLPPESLQKPIIMIGPGTGVAPFRGFMQERIAGQASSKNWLFFGERHQKSDFYYQNYWEGLVKAGKLNLDCAFSRDQEETIYVQHRMLDNSSRLWEWINEGAYLYVCGDAAKMAKDVELTLQQIIEKEGGISSKEAKSFLKNLKMTGRYQRDVY